MLKKAERLTVSDIEALSQGKSVFGTLFSMRYVSAPKTKFAVAVSKKIAPLAVDRNRIRRRAYAAVEKIKGSIKTPIYTMLMPKKEFMGASFNDLVHEAEVVFRKAGLLSTTNK